MAGEPWGVLLIGVECAHSTGWGARGESFLLGPLLGPDLPSPPARGEFFLFRPGSALPTGGARGLLIGPEAVGPARGRWFGGDSTDSSCGVSEDP